MCQTCLLFYVGHLPISGKVKTNRTWGRHACGRIGRLRPPPRGGRGGFSLPTCSRTRPTHSPLLLPLGAQPPQAIAMNGEPYHEALFASILPDLSMAAFASSIFFDIRLPKLSPVGFRSLIVKTDVHNFSLMFCYLSQPLEKHEQVSATWSRCMLKLMQLMLAEVFVAYI